MSDVHEDNITMSELDQEPKTLEDYEILVKQLVSTRHLPNATSDS